MPDPITSFGSPGLLAAASFEQHRELLVRSCSSRRIRPARDGALNQSCLCGTGMLPAILQGYHVQLSRHVSPAQVGSDAQNSISYGP